MLGFFYRNLIIISFLKQGQKILLILYINTLFLHKLQSQNPNFFKSLFNSIIMALQKNDFIEIEFSAKEKDNGELFDSNIKEVLEKHGAQQSPEQAKPFIFPLGQEMFVQGVDEFLIGKPEPSENSDPKDNNYIIELTPEKAFGSRDPKMIQKMSSTIFKQQQVNPAPGQVFNFDGKIGKVLAVSGGRVIVDFNNPLAGKDVVYEVNIKRKLTDINEKTKNLIEFLFKKQFDFDIDEKSKRLTIKADQNYKKFIELFKEKFKEILDLDLEVEEIQETVNPETGKIQESNEPDQSKENTENISEEK